MTDGLNSALLIIKSWSLVVLIFVTRKIFFIHKLSNKSKNNLHTLWNYHDTKL